MPFASSKSGCVYGGGKPTRRCVRFDNRVTDSRETVVRVFYFFEYFVFLSLFVVLSYKFGELKVVAIGLKCTAAQLNAEVIKVSYVDSLMWSRIRFSLSYFWRFIAFVWSFFGTFCAQRFSEGPVDQKREVCTVTELASRCPSYNIYI